MSVHMVIELRDPKGAQTIIQALDAYKVRLRAGIERTRQRLAEFEARYGADRTELLLQFLPGFTTVSTHVHVAIEAGCGDHMRQRRVRGKPVDD